VKKLSAAFKDIYPGSDKPTPITEGQEYIELDEFIEIFKNFL
jgi:hypothetical protein